MNFSPSDENSVSSFPSISSTFLVEETEARAGYILTMISAILSTISSFLILNSIRLSNQKLSTTYHRIMALMCVFDVIASICMALTTLPMPSDDILRFAGPMLGNKTTCQIQGYMVTLGLTGGGTLYACLSWYFVFRITFKMDFHKIISRVEPILYIYPAVVILFLPNYILSKDLIHTLPRSSFCIIGPAHAHCAYSIEKKYFVCDLDVRDEYQKSLLITNALVGTNIIMIFVSMAIIIWTVLKRNQNIKLAHETTEENLDDSRTSYNNDDKHDLETTNENLDDLRASLDNEINISDLRYSRVLVNEALMYIFAYFTTWVFMIVPMVTNADQEATKILLLLKSILFPMQGFWNLLIFVYDKSYLVHHSVEKKTCFTIIKIVLFKPTEAPEIILPSRLMCANMEAQSAIQGVKADSADHGHNLTKDVINIDSNFSGSSSSSTRVIHRTGVEYLGNENHQRYYKSINGLKRTGSLEDRRHGRIYSSDSVESPVGDYGGSVGSNVRMMNFRNYSLDVIEEE